MSRSSWPVRLAPSDQRGGGSRPRLHTQQRNAERDPRALEDEEGDVVDRIDIEGDRDGDARCFDERQHPCAGRSLADRCRGRSPQLFPEARSPDELADAWLPDELIALDEHAAP